MTIRGRNLTAFNLLGKQRQERYHVMSRNWFSNIHSGLIAGAFIPTAAIMIAFAALTVAAPAFARSSLGSSSAPATYYALPPSEEGSLAVPATPIEKVRRKPWVEG
jgi:hypothetical protein